MTTKLIRSLGGNSNGPTDLLDRFAEAALTGLLADPSLRGPTSELAMWCYSVAAEMVKARLGMIQELAVRAGYTAHEPGQPIPLPAHTPVELVLTGGGIVETFAHADIGYDFVAYRDMSRPMAEGA